ncbi:MAG: hypothetical protein AAFP04_16555 [Myxococcota bacterium]
MSRKTIAVVASFILGCAASSSSTGSSTSSDAAPNKKVPVPSEIPVREYMGALAREVHELDGRLQSGSDPESMRAGLGRILEIADDLERDHGGETGHPLIANNLERFVREVKYAMDSVEHPQHGLVYAGRVVGACATCHDVRACPFDSYSRCVDKSTPPSAL